MMIIRKAEKTDIPVIMEVYRLAQDYMIREGNPDQWGHTYPSERLVRQDVSDGISYVLEEDGVHAVFVMFPGPEPNYEYIEGNWINDEPYIAIHRVASDGTLRGVVTSLMDHCKNLADNIRIDTHEKNLSMQRQLEKNGFLRCGIVYMEDGTRRIAYQWQRNG